MRRGGIDDGTAPPVLGFLLTTTSRGSLIAATTEGGIQVSPTRNRLSLDAAPSSSVKLPIPPRRTSYLLWFPSCKALFTLVRGTAWTQAAGRSMGRGAWASISRTRWDPANRNRAHELEYSNRSN
jgi:hypothetical protein